ncbi:MAG: hypothetical protein AB1782_03285 [Cyanobacteriota bacterium]
MKKVLFALVLSMFFINLGSSSSFAQDYYNYNYDPVNQNLARENEQLARENQELRDERYDPYIDERRKSTVDSAIKDAAIGAGAGYFFSGHGHKVGNSLLGAGIGTAFSLLK